MNKCPRCQMKLNVTKWDGKIYLTCDACEISAPGETEEKAVECFKGAVAWRNFEAYGYKSCCE